MLELLPDNILINVHGVNMIAQSELISFIHVNLRSWGWFELVVDGEVIWSQHLDRFYYSIVEMKRLQYYS